MGQVLTFDELRGGRPFTLIFHHIPKTAGTTLNSVLDANYPAARIHSIESPIADALAVFRALPAARKRELLVIRGHGVSGLHAQLEQACCYATLLRDPIERVVSQYAFIRHAPGHPRHAEVMAAGGTLEGYLDRGVNLQADNGQVRALAAWDGPDPMDVPFGTCTPAMLAQALANLARYALVGVTERFDDFLSLAQRVVGWRELGYTRRKVTNTRPRVGDLSPRERELLEQCNRLDRVLYEAAVKRAEEHMERLA